MKRLPLWASVVVVAGLVLAGCADSTAPENLQPNGLESKTPIGIFQTGAQATTDSDDVNVSGEVAVNGDPSTMISKFGGPKAESQVTSGKSKYQIKADERVIYVRGNLEFWTELVGRSQALSIGDKWVASLKAGPLAPFDYFVNLDSFFRGSGNIVKGKQIEVDGRPAITIVDPPSNTDSTWAFATTGDPVALEFESGGTTSLTFDYDVQNIIDMPDVADTVDATELKIPQGKTD